MTRTAMDESFNEIAAISVLPATALQDLFDKGFAVISGPVAPDKLPQLTEAYDAAVATASADDKRTSRTGSNTRVRDFVNRSVEFDGLYLHGPVLEACCRIILQPFKLSTMHSRTVLPHSESQGLHVDFSSDNHGWPMVGFIIMIDEFRIDNGSTRFIPGSHKWSRASIDRMTGLVADDERQVVATGSAGSVIVYNGSVLHGFTANRSDEPRRSIQGAYIRRDAESSIDWAVRLLPQTRERISSLAAYLLDA